MVRVQSHSQQTVVKTVSACLQREAEVLEASMAGAAELSTLQVQCASV